MNIAIYDTEHFETTYTLLQLLNRPGNKITLLVTEDIAARLKSMPYMDQVSQFHWEILPDKSYWNTYTIHQVCRRRKIEFLYFNTIAHHHLFFGIMCRLLPKTQILLTIHDANSFFKPRFRFTPKGFLQYIGKKVLAGAVSYYATLLEATRSYIQKEFRPAKNIVTIPGSFYDEAVKHADNPGQHTIIAIPGSVDTKRRNYEILFAALSHWSQQDQKREIILLGGASNEAGAEVIHRCKAFSSQNLQVTTYEEPFISQQEYDRQLQRCDFIYAPLQRYFQEKSTQKENYGLTKSSGCFFDAIRFAKPLLLPADILLPDEIAPQTIVHDSASSLVNFVSNLDQAEKAKYKTLAVQNASRFTLPVIRKKLTLEGLAGFES